MSENEKKKKKTKKIIWVFLGIGLIWILIDGIRGCASGF